MRWVLVGALGLILAGSSPHAPAAAQGVPYVPIVDLLPPLAGADPAADMAEVCGDDGLVCVRLVEQQLAGWESYFGCDHRAVFPTVYRMLTQHIRFQLEDDPTYFDDPAGLGWESVLFYELYEEMILAHLAGEPIPDAWQVVMDVAQEGDWTGGHDMLLAINAHVQRDMPFAVAEVGIVLPDGTSRKGDHDRFNHVLARAYDPIVREIGRRYDPFMNDISEVPIAAELGAMQMVASWREGVWRNAEALTTTAGTALEPIVVLEIETHSWTWAQLLATGEIPGRRALRQAHCEAFLAAQAADAGQGDDAVDDNGEERDDEPAGDDEPTMPSTGGGAALLGGVLVLWAVRRNGHTRRA